MQMQRTIVWKGEGIQMQIRHELHEKKKRDENIKRKCRPK